MDTSLSREVAKRCFKLKPPLYDKLNVLYNKSTLMLAFWNKYQIFLYENMDIERDPISFVPEFVTHEVILSQHFLLCLDSNGNVHIHSLKFKNPTQKHFKGMFQPREQSVVTFVQHSEDHAFSIKLEHDKAYLCLHKITSDFQLKHKMLLGCDFPIALLHELQGKCVLRTLSVTKRDFESVRLIFNVTHVENDSVLIIITFNGLDVYTCLYNQRMTGEELKLIKLYSCPLEIQDILILQADFCNVLIGLKSGTVIRLPFESRERKPQIIHLNISILKFLGFKDTLVYTDGSSMWKSDKTFTQKEIMLTQLFVKFTRDFIMFDNQILCVTYSNLIYLFTIEDEAVFVKSLAENDFYAAEQFLESSTQHDQITTELLKNLELAEKMRVESNYIATMALANRKDVIKEVIKYKVVLFDCYEEARNEESDLRLTNEMHEYFEPETVMFLVQVTFAEQHKLNDVFVTLLQDLKLHMTIFSGDELLKTVSVNVDQVLKEIKILIPMKVKDISCVTIRIRLIPGLPGALDENQRIWIVLSQEEMVLNCEHFIKSTNSHKNIVCLKKSPHNLENLILASANILHGQLFSFTNTEEESSVNEWKFFVKLPKDSSKLLSNEESYLKHFNKAKSAFLQKTFSSQDFLRGKTETRLQIGNETACLKIIEDDISGLLLMISSCNIKTAQHLRIFISGLLYGDYGKRKSGKVFVPQAQYAIIEDLQRSLKSSLVSEVMNEERILNIAEQFHRNVLGALPL